MSTNVAATVCRITWQTARRLIRRADCRTFGVLCPNWAQLQVVSDGGNDDAVPIATPKRRMSGRLSMSGAMILTGKNTKGFKALDENLTQKKQLPKSVVNKRLNRHLESVFRSFLMIFWDEVIPALSHSPTRRRQRHLPCLNRRSGYAPPRGETDGDFHVGVGVLMRRQARRFFSLLFSSFSHSLSSFSLFFFVSFLRPFSPPRACFLSFSPIF